MAVKYACRPKRNVIGGNNDVLYYAIPTKSGKVDLDMLAEHLSEQSSLTKSDVYATMIGLTALVEKYLHNGYRVKLGQLGTFYLSVTSAGYESEEACTPKKVIANKICFKADDKLRKNLKKVQFERG
ncbi:HU family DNA-binding protein [Olivibacter sitiensis]|uniref:HU family DNA-binding protein n=1 Tax=Olivibacter sitiensis TaxID=376470 RepID=UPI0003FB1A03|nr:HU family DNA-binding protein [Olivibacter sitiensis]